MISGAQSWRFTLQAERSTVGKAVENDVALEHDPTASHLHAILERFPAGWCVTPRERDVLVALCRPLPARDMFTEPASTRAIAEELVIPRRPSSSTSRTCSTSSASRRPTTTAARGWPTRRCAAVRCFAGCELEQLSAEAAPPIRVTHVKEFELQLVAT